ncbi:MAG: AraC family transcriptional regulator [Pseudomonadota bacterium]
MRTALTVRLLLPRGPRKGSSRAASALPRPVLQRVLERMHDLENEPDLRELAAQGGYSRGHFLRMFRATTGLTPHRYLLQLRVEKAQRQLALGRASLIEIAADSGLRQPLAHVASLSSAVGRHSE